MIKKTHTGYDRPGHIHYHDVLSIYEPTTILGLQQPGKSQGDPGNAPCCCFRKAELQDLFVAIFKQNISKQSKDWEEQASLITLSILNPTVCHGLKRF